MSDSISETAELVSNVTTLLDACSARVSQLEGGISGVAGSPDGFAFPAALPRLRLLEARMESVLQAMEGQMRQQRGNDARGNGGR